jgi:transketolase
VGTYKPYAIIAHTTKGKGVSFMENAPEWHAKKPTADRLKQAYEELI